MTTLVTSGEVTDCLAGNRNKMTYLLLKMGHEVEGQVGIQHRVRRGLGLKPPAKGSIYVQAVPLVDHSGILSTVWIWEYGLYCKEAVGR